MSVNLPSEDPLIRMQRDLKRAKAKNLKEIKWGMVIDIAKCIGCHACTIACVAENKLPPGVVYRVVLEEETGTYPSVGRRFVPRPCVQCQNPPCVKVCPVTATYKNEQGVVVVNYNRCIGCRYCLVACPYAAEPWISESGIRIRRRRPPETGEPKGGKRIRKQARRGIREKVADRGKGSPIGNARKCHFCLHRLAVGMLPACVTTCVGRATIFGDRTDPQSLVYEQIGSQGCSG